MPLLRNGHAVADAWQHLADDQPLPEQGPVLVSLARWQAEQPRLASRTAPLGVRLANTDPVEALAADLPRLSLIVLEFPKFTDGRAYTQARKLRETLGYLGELRATGEVLEDQLLFMQRCGFDAFDMARPDAEAAWARATQAFQVFYQPTGDGRSPVSSLRRRLGGGGAP